MLDIYIVQYKKDVCYATVKLVVRGKKMIMEYGDFKDKYLPVYRMNLFGRGNLSYHLSSNILSF